MRHRDYLQGFMPSRCGAACVLAAKSAHPADSPTATPSARPAAPTQSRPSPSPGPARGLAHERHVPGRLHRFDGSRAGRSTSRPLQQRGPTRRNAAAEPTGTRLMALASPRLPHFSTLFTPSDVRRGCPSRRTPPHPAAWRQPSHVSCADSCNPRPPAPPPPPLPPPASALRRGLARTPRCGGGQ